MAFTISSDRQFFKIILPQTLVQGKIDIPKKFVTKNGGAGFLFRKTATLRLPGGAIWEVQVEKSGSKVSFSRGWLDFLNFYSIRVGYLLVFKLDESSCFGVSIFDFSATEIDYPIKLQTFCRIPKDNSGGSSGLAPSLVVKIESESDEETGSFPKMRKKMKKNKNKNKKQLTVAQRLIDDEDEDEDEDLEMNFSKRQSNVRGSVISESNHGDDDDDPESMRPITPRKRLQPLTKNQEQVLRLASLFKCNRKNPSFMVTMRPSYIQTGCYLSLPRNFAERYVKESMDVKLELDDGRVWSVWCGVRWALMRRRTEFKGGWKTFAFDNKLKDGDACVFELIHRSLIAFYRVTIFRRPLN